MPSDQKVDIDIINLIIGISALVIPSTFFFITAPEKIRLQTLIIFGIITTTIIIILISYLVYGKFKNISKEVEDNKKEIRKMKNSLNTNNLFNDMAVRLKVLEQLMKKNKKGIAIDLRIIWAIILILLLLLFLKSIGFF